ncbi:MAG: hypothetical protein KRP56_05650 [Candidatus Methanogranum gryphiswaldense]|nr:MAG: hypothetical protein KRP56_05650 [Candidatus Methanogranum sp. U3.2.1]
MMKDLMKGRPLKFRLLEVLADGSTMWNYDIVKQMMDEYGMTSNFQRDNVNFDLIELQASGFIEAVESEVDESGKLRQGALLNKYKITSLGKGQYDELCAKVKGA